MTLLVFQKIHQVFRNLHTVFIRRGQVSNVVQNIGFNNSVDPVNTTGKIRRTYPVPCVVNRNLCPERRPVADINIMHTFQGQRDAGINFNNDFLRMFYENRRVADAGPQHDVALFRNGSRFHHRYIYVAYKPVINQRTEMAQMTVNIMDAPIIQSFTQRFV